MSTSNTPAANNELLASLPPEAADLLLSRLELMDLTAGAGLYEMGTELRKVYFPVTAIIALVSPLADGTCIEVAVVGREGIAGVGSFMGGGQALTSAVVQRAGLAWQMSARELAEVARDSEPVMRPLLRYAKALLTQMAQTSACHRHHALCQQLCRWLLQRLDRQNGDEMQVTQERIAGLLGVRREGITGATKKLQQDGLIRCSRGRIQVLDRRGLEEQSCECYRVVQQACEELQSAVSPSPGAPASAGRRMAAIGMPV
jgi:CRP-like cAMP-binding protein